MSNRDENDQLQPEDTLDDRGLEDKLDEGISPPEKLRGSTAKSTTAAGELEGETIEDRLPQEEPDPVADVQYDEPPADPLSVEQDDDVLDDGYVGEDRSGRLVAPDAGVREDEEKDLVGDDVGIDGAGASAEEAAVHTVDEDQPPA